MFRRAFLAVQGNGQPILTPEELEVAQAAYVAAQNAANPGQPIDPNYGIAGNDAKLKEVLITFERALDVFKISNNARSKFLKNYETWAPLCKENIRVLRNLAEELLKERHERNKDRAIGGAIGGTAQLAAILWCTCPPAALAAGVASAIGASIGLVATYKENEHLKETFEKARARINKEKRQYSEMASWFHCPEGLHEKIFSLIDYDVYKKISQEVQKCDKEWAYKEVALKDFNRLLEYCMKEMAKDKNMIKKYGKELAPAVMTFVFVICLMQDHNRIVLDSSLITARLAVDCLSGLNLGILGIQLAGSLARGAAGAAFAKYAGHAICNWCNLAINVLITGLSVYELCNGPDPTHANKLKKVADEYEKVLFYIEKVYKDTKKLVPQEGARFRVAKSPRLPICTIYLPLFSIFIIFLAVLNYI